MLLAAKFPELNELSAFFECDPTLSDTDVPWYYGRLAFQTTRDGISVSAVFEPTEGFLDVTLRVGAQEIAAAQIRSVGSVELHHDAGRETLSAAFGAQHESRLWLTLKPAVRLGCEGRDGVAP